LPFKRLNAGWSSPVARQAHNLKVVSSNLAPATKLSSVIQKPRFLAKRGFRVPRANSQNPRKIAVKLKRDAAAPRLKSVLKFVLAGWHPMRIRSRDPHLLAQAGHIVFT
jgi:hypothetical protein